MKIMSVLLFSLMVCSAWGGRSVEYNVGDVVFEGYIESAGSGAPVVLLIHDWDGLTEYEVKRSEMLRGALDFAEDQGLDTDNCVAMGYCFGGTAVLEWARSGEPLKGFVSFHGGLELPEGQDYSEAKGEFQIHHSITDGMPPFANLAEDLEKRGLLAQLISYTGAPHGWTVFGSPRYREKPDGESWNHFVQFLEDTLGVK